jgi:hypothetical protein
MHGAAEMALAPLLMFAAFALAFEPVALIAAVALGALLIGSAFHASAKAPRPSVHRQLDLIVIVFAAGAGLGCALSGAPVAAALFASVAGFEGFLTASTSYSAGRIDHG